MLTLILGILLDQLTKLFICNIQDSIIILPQILELEYVENYGAVFGIMQGANNILAVVSLVICVVLSVYIYTKKKNNQKVEVAWYLILAGGIGNLIDRVFRGYVVDFIATPFIATFNIADSMVVIGVVYLLAKECFKWYQEKKNE